MLIRRSPNADIIQRSDWLLYYTLSSIFADFLRRDDVSIGKHKNGSGSRRNRLAYFRKTNWRCQSVH